ncbi:MAG: hypothetical protein ACXVCY_00460 [Pseudobdellovibrionaceae bacterium]
MSVPALKENQMSIPEGGNTKKEPSFFEVGLEQTDLGKPDSFRYNILTCVLNENYDKAIEDLKGFVEKPSEYPNFKDKITRFVNHSIDLIYAIKAKRGFPGINSLTRAKQQELREKFKGHFRELQYILKIIEKIQGDLRVEDVRSTIYVVRALWFCGIAIAITAFWVEIVNGLARASYVVSDDAFGKLANFLAEKIGF